MSHAVAKRYSRVNPDTALLAGLLHGIGQLYILTRTCKHPGLFANQAVYHNIVRDWHSSIAKALLENWNIADEIVDLVGHGLLSVVLACANCSWPTPLSPIILSSPPRRRGP